MRASLRAPLWLLGTLSASVPMVIARASQPAATAAQAAGSASSPSARNSGSAPNASASGVPTTPPPPDATKREEARRLFLAGNDFLRLGDTRQALEFFLRSRSVLRTASNTLNSAICLDRLRRFDEALELYEDLLTHFGDKLDTETRQAVLPAMAQLRLKVGALKVSSNVEGTLVVGGLMRGRLPRGDVRVLPGKHLVRVVESGYEAFEALVEVKVGETVPVDARLKRLVSAGQLRVDDTALEGAEVFLDGAAVGTVPWEATLAPKTYVYWVRKGDLGSAPRPIVVLDGQAVLGRPRIGPLGPEFRLVVEPPSAEIALNGVLIGSRLWQGRLPLGAYSLDVKETGYFPVTQKFEVTAETRSDIQVVLKPDAKHPRWGVPPSGRFLVDALVGLPLSGSFASTAEGYCDGGGCPSRSIVFGGLVAARGTYELPIGIGFGIGAGYMSLRSSVTRSVVQNGDQTGLPASAEYRLDDSLRNSGPFVFGGLSYRRALGSRFTLEGHLEMGVWIAGSADAITGTVTSAAETRPIYVPGSGSTATGATVFLMPGVAAHTRFAKFRLGLGLTAMVFVTEGPTLPNGATQVNASGCAGASVACARDVTFTQGEKAFGRFVVWIPMLTGGYEF